MIKIIKKFILLNLCFLIVAYGIILKIPIKILASQNINSWYSFNSTQPLYNEGTLNNYTYYINAQSSYPIVFDPLGEGEVQSNFITAFIFGNDSLAYRLSYFNQDEQIIDTFDKVVYYAGDWVSNDYKYIFISSNVPDDLMEYLENNGIWAYTQSLPSSTMSDLILSVADIIPNTIQNLTSFEIFGFTLFAIFGTFTLIILLVKLIKGVI